MRIQVGKMPPEERHTYEDLLKIFGFEVTGGGTDLETGEADIGLKTPTDLKEARRQGWELQHRITNMVSQITKVLDVLEEQS